MEVEERLRFRTYDHFIDLKQIRDPKSLELYEDIQEGLFEKHITMIEDEILLRDMAKQIKKNRNPEEKKTLIRKYFAHRPYFRSLFPPIKQQKPGEDLYTTLTYT